ncbi:FBX39 protein, partial [Rostratula benghalensis]|nr:FBX39 protein [Rostratula benghalensis]
MEDEGEARQSPWAHLPDVCLRRIFHWSNDRDRSHAALVCRNWNWALHSGSLWKSRAITFYGRPSREETWALQSALWYVRKFGRHLEHLDIRLQNPYSRTFTRTFQVKMRGVFSHLSRHNHCLRSLSIEYLGLDRLMWKNVVRAQFLKNLSAFLKRMSKRLDYLNLKGARVTLEEGCELLNSLSCSSSISRVSEINIEDFFSLHLPAHSSALFLQTMSKFHSLVVLTFNYNCVSDELLDVLREHSAHSLRTLNIKCHSQDPHEQVVWGMSWANLAKRAPTLSVNFFFERIIRHEHLSKILLVEIPVSSISLRSYNFSDPEVMLRPILTNLLPAYSHILQQLTLELNNDHERLEDELLRLVLSCPRLFFLEVWAFLSVTFVERLLQSREGGKCGLTTLKVRIYTAPQETKKEERLLHDVYRRFKSLIDSELHYFVVVYSMS